MDYPIKTLSQLRPILQGFRKAAALTQAAMASRLGVTQQTYAQLEANPAAVSVERLFKVLRILQVDLKLVQTGAAPGEAAEASVAPPSTSRAPTRRVGGKTTTTAGIGEKRTTATPRKQPTSAAKSARPRTAAKKPPASTTTRRAARGNSASEPTRAAAKSASTGKKREEW
ncbi:MULTISPECIES: helix-turn-helix transcriptional regulator [Burkholderiaceae]|uniref:helix-turn-helix domain-containing protein n=1 Tax=Burkholderiaceae TaxID=119060 RepID=UPI0014229BA2|nr:helix-turn-helix transcriptional regulator [Paraburkholderia sp. Ac-20342]NIF51140.1 helix-turn-helix transcriptional regulator [Burkholderia sp. Ax-1724]